jgi:thymidylate synthase (FAD)
MSSVKLVAVSNPLIEECENAQELIAYCARVSNPSNQANHDTSAKLLKYCADHAHWSIFETVSVCIEIETTRDIGRQILRHKSFSFQEFSQRYAEVDENSFEIRECRLQDKKNRQNSVVTSEKWLEDWWKSALEKGIAKEQARAVLPEGMTMSRMYMNGTLRSWIHYIMLRCGNGTQKEHMEIAMKCRDIIFSEFPSLIGVLS